jgi:hypothetical protein
MATHTVRISAAADDAFVDPSATLEAGPLGVHTTLLSDGRREGVKLVELSAGDTRVVVLPDRGLGIWKMVAGGVELGWQSPVQGPVHPSFVPLAEPLGIGWLDGFDELVARCGLVSNGAPEFDASGRLLYGLHGRIANLPAQDVSVTLDESAGTVTLTGFVDETRFLCHALRMQTKLVLEASRHRITWTDTVTNLSDRPATMQMLYHVNIGPPMLGAGAELVAAVEERAPRDLHAAPDGPSWNRYAGPRPGHAEQVHFARLRPDGDGRATAMLVAPDGRHGAAVSWRADTLPWFTLWKNLGGERDGYVTGLEPATNFPNTRSFEESQGRVVPLAPGASVSFDLALELVSGDQLADLRRTIETLAAAEPPVVHLKPRSGWSPGA